MVHAAHRKRRRLRNLCWASTMTYQLTAKAPIAIVMNNFITGTIWKLCDSMRYWKRLVLSATLYPQKINSAPSPQAYRGMQSVKGYEPVTKKVHWYCPYFLCFQLYIEYCINIDYLHHPSVHHRPPYAAKRAKLQAKFHDSSHDHEINMRKVHSFR